MLGKWVCMVLVMVVIMFGCSGEVGFFMGGGGSMVMLVLGLLIILVRVLCMLVIEVLGKMW